MKKTILLLLTICIVIVTAGCNNKQIKSEYAPYEEAMIDDIYVTLKKVEKINNSLQITFDITNKTKDTLTLDADTNFKFYDREILLSNNYMDNPKALKKKEKRTYILQYEYKEQKLYSIYFYSGVVENNIKFTFTSNDIKMEQ